MYSLLVGLMACGSSAAPDRPVAPPPRAAEEKANGPRLVAQLGHDRQLSTVSFSPDGRLALTADFTVAKLWQTSGGTEVQTIGGADTPVAVARFLRGGRRIATSGNDGVVRLWDARSGVLIRSVAEKEQQFTLLAVGADRDWVLVGVEGGETRVYDIAAGKEVGRLASTEGATCGAFSADGTRVATGTSDGVAVIWDATTRKEVGRCKGHSGAVFSASFSPDGRRLLTGAGDGTARLWDVKTGNEVRKFQEKGEPLEAVDAAFSPDGDRVFTAAASETVRSWDARTGKEVRTFKFENGSFLGAVRPRVAVHPRENLILTADLGEFAVLWDSATGREVRLLKSRVRHNDNRGRSSGDFEWASTLAVSPSGRLLLLGGPDRLLRLWDLPTGRAGVSFGGPLVFDPPPLRLLHDDETIPAAFSPDGRLVATGGGAKNSVVLFDVGTGKVVRHLTGHSGWVSAVTFTPDGKSVVSGSWDKTARLWDVRTGKPVRVFKGHTEHIHQVAVSPDGKLLVTGSGEPARIEDPESQKPVKGDDDSARVWNLPTGTPARARLEHVGEVTGLAFSPDGGRLVTTAAHGTIHLWDTTTWKELHREENSNSPRGPTFGPVRGQVIVSRDRDEVCLWNPADGKTLPFVKGHDLQLPAIPFGQRVITAGQDGTVRIWGSDGRELCRLITFIDGTWAVSDPAGRYDASNGGDVAGLHWVVGLEPIALSQLKNRYYEPGLLAKVLGFNKEPLREVEAFTAPKLYPDVAVTPPAAGATAASVTLTNRGGGIGKVVVRVNGKELVADARGPKPDPDAAAATLAVDLSAAPNLVPGKPNRVEVVAYNAEGYLSSRAAAFDYDAPAAAPADPPRLHAIVCGVSTYAGPKLNLRYAAKDAEDFAAALTLAGTRLFGAGNVRVAVLTTTDKPGHTPPTKENIRKAFEAVQKAAKPADLFVVYLAGHGTTLSRGSDLYLYPTRDATSLAPDAFADPAVLAATAVTSDELTEWVKRVPANKQVMILDTCAAGAAAAKLTEKRDVSGDQVRALDRLKDRTGFHVLMGCSADAVSYETTRFAQGLLTYTLLEAMRGAALRDGEYVDIAKLFAYATDRVPALAGDVGGVQRPLVAAPRGTSFDVGRLTAADKTNVPLALARPLVLQSNFQDEGRLKDVIGLKKLVDDRLRAGAAGGRGAGAVFVDAAEFPGAFEVAGRYKIDGDKVTVRVTVYRGEAEVAAFAVEGDKTKPDDLAARTVAEVERRLPAAK